MSTMTVLAKSGEAVKAGPIGFAVIILLCIACYFLFKSMSKHLRKVREEFPSDAPAVPHTEFDSSAVEPTPSDRPTAPPSTSTPGT